MEEGGQQFFAKSQEGEEIRIFKPFHPELHHFFDDSRVFMRQMVQELVNIRLIGFFVLFLFFFWTVVVFFAMLPTNPVRDL
jgi:hypothetical protein